MKAKFLHYVIVDDETDILPEQCSHFIMTDGDTGFSLSDFTKFEEIHLRSTKVDTIK